MLIVQKKGEMRHYRDRNFHGSHHGEDATLWVLIQRVCRREDDKDRRLQAATQLNEFVMKPEAKVVLSKSPEQILNALIDVFFERSGITLQKDVANIIASIGHILSNEPYQFFQWILRQLQSIANDNVRNYLLDSLNKLLELDLEERRFDKVIGLLMDELQAALENIDLPEHLPVCINPLILVAQNYPSAFSKHFRDTVDILVGWHIDHTQKMSLTLFASESLVKLHAHWLTDLQFSLTLLSQFLEDMEAYAEDFHKLQNGESPGESDDDSSSMEVYLAKMAALMRVFSTVVRSIGPVFHANTGPPITESFILESLQRIIFCAQLADDGSLAVSQAADECARLLLGAVHWKAEDMLSESLLTYAVHAVERSSSEARLLLVLEFVTVMVQEIGSALPSWFIQGLLGPSSRLLPLKHSRNNQLCQELLALYQACLAVKSVPLLQTAYKYIAGEFQEAINGLLRLHAADKTTTADNNPVTEKSFAESCDVKMLSVISENPFEASNQHAEAGGGKDSSPPHLVVGDGEAELIKTALFDIVALLEIADAKNSLIGMYALTPSIFELFSTSLLVFRDHLAALFPTLHHSILHALYSHCQRHKNFTSSYSGGAPVPPVDPGGGSFLDGGGSFLDNVTTATHRHYPSILNLLSNLLLHKTTSSDSRTLMLHWSREILERLRTSKDTSLLGVSSFADLIHAVAVAGLQNIAQHSLLAASCLQVTMQVFAHASSKTDGVDVMMTSLYDLVAKCCVVNIWNVDGGVRKAFSDLLTQLPLDKILSVMNHETCTSHEPTKQSGQHKLTMYGLRQSWLAKRLTASKSPAGDCSFHSHHFKDLMDRMLKPNPVGNTFTSEWLEQLYWSCQRLNPSSQPHHHHGASRPPLDPHIPSMYTYDKSFIFWWALWKAAEYTVTNKLRTPLGRPQDTFQRIEGAVRDYERKLLASGMSPSSSSGHGTSRGKFSPRTSAFASWSSLQHPHLLLQFFDNLEKLLYNAYEGCAVSIHPQHKTIKTFFYTNRQTCEQWLNRLRLAVMRIGLSCGLPTISLQHGEAVLHDMRTRNNTSGLEFESAVAMVIDALIRLRSPYGIEGMYRWCREMSGAKQQWVWMKAAKLHASNSYEDALREYQLTHATSRKSHADVSSSGDATKNDVTLKPSSGDATKTYGDAMTGSPSPGSKRTTSPARSLVLQQSLKCYLNLNHWKEAQDWVKNSPKDDVVPSYLTNINYIQALNSFEQSDFKSTSESCYKMLGGGKPHPVNGQLIMTAGQDYGVGMGMGNKSWNWQDLLCACELQLINCVVKMKTGSEKESTQAISALQQVIDSALSCLKLKSSYRPTVLPPGFHIVFVTANAVKKAIAHKQSCATISMSSNVEKGSWMCGTTGNRLLSLLEHSIDNTQPKMKKLTSDLRISMIKMNRKCGNHKRAHTLLQQEISLIVEPDDDKLTDLSGLTRLCRALPSDDATNGLTSLRLQCESGKLLHAAGRSQDGMILLAHSVATYLENGHKSNGDATCCRGLLNLVRYLQADWKSISPDLKDVSRAPSSSDSPLLSKLKLLMAIERNVPMSFAKNTKLATEVNQEIVLGSLLNLATKQAPELAKSWFSVAGWCYKWGRKIMDAANSAGSVELIDDEEEQVQTILKPLGVSEEQLEEVYGVLRRAHCSTASMQVEGDALDDIASGSSSVQRSQPNYNDISEAVLEQLSSRCGSWLQRAPHHVTQSLLAVWHRVCVRLFAQYQLAAHAYFKFLNLNTGQLVTQKYEDSNVTATLRLLRLLVKHALELQSTLKTGFATAPTNPWKGIIPQLFSRLNHPESYVRRSITDLLCRVALQSPHLIIYPVVVATTRSDPRTAHTALRATLDEQDDVDFDDVISDDVTPAAAEASKLKEDDAEGGVTNFCYKQVLQSLSEQDDAKVRDVQLLVLELRRITLLWDELWLGTLNQHQQDIMRRLQQLHDEAKRVNVNTTLTKAEKQAILKEQQQAIMRPVVYAMRRVHQITCMNPETPHERWFADFIQPLIESALDKLLKPPNPNSPRSCWSGFKQVHNLLEARSTKRASHILNLAEISPKLMKLKSTTVPIPGVTDSKNKVTVEGCSTAVTILPTKTKPKKLQFIGSDGRRYTYLFKGLEDLHLDERVMQFLSITNHLLRRQHENRGYVARHYAVTPLGPRSGLIQWVTGATPLFLLYKRWQQRQAITQANKQMSSSTAVQNIQILRPSDLFYNKLNPQVKKAGVDIDRMSRKDWPKDILSAVFDELLHETPDDLLQKELWCASTCAAEYWNMQQKYSQSTAVMSMIGYVIGLGDRHLDNVLIDLESGEVVHIDYNVCFEKGLQLRVPERVPFRLTQNLVRALGLTGVEGVFRNSCEQVLSTLRKGRETLLTLLEAFVYDPLVDWTGAVEGGYAGAVYGGGGQQQASKVGGKEDDKLSKKDMEREITRSLFSSRVAEMKQGWFNNRDEMLKTLPILVEKLKDYKTHFKNNVTMNENIQDLLEVKSHVKVALNDSRHAYHTLPQRWQQHQQQQYKKEALLNTLQDKVQVCNSCTKRYARLLSVLQSPELAALLAEASSKLELGSCAFTHAFKFLHSAGQANMVTQAQMTEKEVMSVSEQRRLAMRSCVDVLSQYAAIAAHFPPQAAIRQHREQVWSKRLEKVSDCLIRIDVGGIRHELDRCKAKDIILAQSRSASVKDVALQREVTDLETELLKLIDRRNREPIGIGRNTDADRVVETCRENIVNYVQEQGLEGLGAFTGALSLLLCALDQRAIVMEKTAASSGHRLVDMTSQEGDWFLEELCGLFANMMQLLHLNEGLIKHSVKKRGVESPPASGGVVHDATRAVICSEKIYRTLLELFNNFRNIIVPEAVKLLQCEEPSVIELVSAVGGILQGVRLDDIAKQLMGCLRNHGMQNGAQFSYDEALVETEKLKSQYNQLLQDSQQQSSDQRLTAGQMLLQAFDGLFRSVLTDFNALLSARDQVYASGHVVQEWSYVDVLHEPLQLQKFKKLSGAGDTLQALLFIKQLQAMHDFFVLCQSNARSIVVDRMPPTGGKTTGHHYMASKCLYTEERLAKPIKHFISHFVQELLIGIPSEMVGCTLCAYVELLGVELANFALPTAPLLNTEEVCKAAIENKYTQNFLAKPSMLVYQFNRAWKDYDRVQRLDSNILSVKSSRQRAQLQVTRFQWLHEDLLDSNPANLAIPRRCDVMNDLNKRMSSLAHLDNMLHQVQEKAMSQNTSIQQRLKWAAGANPTLQTVLSSVEADVLSRKQLLAKEDSLSSKILEICEHAVAFEKHRLTSSSSDVDDEFMKLLTQSEHLCRAIASSPVQIDQQERITVEVLPPKPSAVSTDEWLQKVTEKLSSTVSKKRNLRQQEESKMLLVKSNLRDLVASVKQLLSSHGRLLSDVKALLKTMAKEEDSSDDATTNKTDANSSAQVGSVRKYMERYKELTSSLNNTLMDVLQGCDATTMLDPDPLIERLSEISGMVTGLYEDLVAFAAPNLDLVGDLNQPTFATALRTGQATAASRSSPAFSKRVGMLATTAGSSNQNAASGGSAGTPNQDGVDFAAGVHGEGSVSAGGSNVADAGGSVPGKSAAVTSGGGGAATAAAGAGASPRKKVRDPKTGKAIQERNYFAVSVWRRVKAKLDGKDVDSNKRTQVAEQVDQVLTEATSADNLSLLYEGWTAWV